MLAMTSGVGLGLLLFGSLLASLVYSMSVGTQPCAIVPSRRCYTQRTSSESCAPTTSPAGSTAASHGACRYPRQKLPAHGLMRGLYREAAFQLAAWSQA